MFWRRQKAISLTALCSVLCLIILQNYSCNSLTAFFQKNFLLTFEIFSQVKKKLVTQNSGMTMVMPNVCCNLHLSQKPQAQYFQPGCFSIAFPPDLSFVRPTASKAPYLSNKNSIPKTGIKTFESYPSYPYIQSNFIFYMVKCKMTIQSVNITSFVKLYQLTEVTESGHKRRGNKEVARNMVEEI